MALLVAQFVITSCKNQALNIIDGVCAKNNFESFLEGVDELFPGFLLANCFDNRDTLLLVNTRRRILWTPLRNKAGFTVKAFINVNMSK